MRARTTTPDNMAAELRDIARRRGAGEGLLIGAAILLVLCGAILVAVHLTVGLP